MSERHKFRELVLGAPRDPFNPKTRQHIALAALLAWVGLGADGLSSSAYGPEAAFVALGEHTHLSLYMAVVTAITVFVIALAYNQVIELFPSGGGGYKVASRLINPYAGLFSGAALIVDYVLTIAISIASGIDALFSLLPPDAQAFKLIAELALVALLMFLNLRGMKESIRILLPIFFGFVVTHGFLIVYGIAAHADRLPVIVRETVDETFGLSAQMGWIFVLSLFLRAYSLGGGTYTGIEAVSNNIDTLAEPRVKTGKLTMLYMALSLAFTAGGIILLYLLWNAVPVAGQTLNAVTFKAIIDSLAQGEGMSQALLLLALAFEGGLLFVAANTGFLGGPSVLSNMAVDSWVPRHFRELSNRLVRQNGLVLMGLAAFAILLWSDGRVEVLVILYSINVFLTFLLSLLGLCVHWVRNRGISPHWLRRLLLSIVGVIVTGGILLVTLIEKFGEGGWMTVVITSSVVAVCLLIKQHYDETRMQLRQIDKLFAPAKIEEQVPAAPALEPQQPTAIFLVGKNRGVGMHTLLWVQRLFPDHFKNFIFLSAGEVDAESFDGQGALRTLQYQIRNSLRYYTNFCHSHGLAAAAFDGYGIDPIAELDRLTEKVMNDFPNSVCFASKLIFVHDNIFTRWLHNQTALLMQRRLHLRGRQMVILPMKVS